MPSGSRPGLGQTPTMGYPGWGAVRSWWRLPKQGQAPGRAGSSCKRAFKATAASWEGQPLRGRAWVWEVVGRRGSASSEKHSLKGARSEGFLRSENRSGFLYPVSAEGRAGVGGRDGGHFPDNGVGGMNSVCQVPWEHPRAVLPKG